MPYDSRMSGTIADLLLRKGDIAARAGLQSSAAWQQGISTIGDVVGGTVASLARIRADEPRRKLEELNVESAKRQLGTEKAVADAWQITGGDPDKTAEVLKQMGHGPEALKIGDDTRRRRLDTLNEEAAKMEMTQHRLGLATSLLPLPPESDDPAGIEAFRATYTEALPKLREILGPDLSKFTPEADDPQLPQKVGRLYEIGMTTAEKIRARSDAIKFAKDAQADTAKADEYFTKSLSTWLPTVDSQEEWTQALQSAKALGAPTVTLDKFGAQYTPDAAEKARMLGLTPEQQGKVGKEGDITPTASDRYNTWVGLVGDAEDKKGRPLTKAERGRLWQQAKPAEKSDADGLTAANKETTRRQAESWRNAQLADLSKRQKPTQIMGADYRPVMVPALSAEEIAAEKMRIDEGYTRMLGGQATPPAAPPPAPKVAPARAVSPAAANRGEVPTGTAALIKAKGEPGIYEMTDGSKWELRTDGTIQSIR